MYIISGKGYDFKVGDHVIVKDHDGKYMYHPVKAIKGRNLTLDGTIVISTKCHSVEPVTPAIGSLCLGGLIEDDPDEKKTELKPFRVVSVGPNFVYGTFVDNDKCEMKLLKSQLCKIPSENISLQSSFASTSCESCPKLPANSGVELSEDISSYTTKDTKSVNFLLQVNKRLLQQYYYLYEDYEAAKEENEMSQQKLADLNELYEQALTNLEKIKKELDDLKVDNQELQKQTEHLKALKEIMKVTYERRIKKLQDENAVLKEEGARLEDMKRKSFEMEEENPKVVKIRPLGSKSKPSFYLKLPQNMQPASTYELGSKSLKNRAKIIYTLLEQISGPSKKDIITTLTQFLNENPDLTTETAAAANSRKLSPGESVDLKLFLGLPMNKFRKMREFFQSKGISLLSSEGKMRKEIKERSYQEVEVKTLQMKKKSKDEEVSNVAVVSLTNLDSHIKDTLEKDQSQQLFDKQLYIKIGGDKGGTSTKIVYEIIGCSKPAVHIISIFEAYDSVENLTESISCIKEQIVTLKDKEFNVNGVASPIQVFLYGDYEFLCHCLGHQGASASFPCIICHVPLADLQARDGKPHTPLCSDYTERTIDSYHEDLSENIRTSDDLHKSGKFHHSVVGPMVIPPVDLTHVVPPGLHILLGLTLKFFNMLLERVKEIDNNEMSEDTENEFVKKGKEKEELEVESEEVSQKIDALEFVLNKIGSRSRGKRGKGSCSAYKCFSYDDNTVECDSCQSVFHVKCVGVSELDVKNKKHYRCFLCRNVTINSQEDFQQHIEVELKNAKCQLTETQMKLEALEKQLLEMEEIADSNIGSKEKQLLDTLASLSIDRQAYHSHSFVGNHCMKLLENADKITSVLDDEAERDQMNLLFQKFLSIYRLMSKNAILSKEEIECLTNECHSFGEWFPAHFPSSTLPIKFHLLTHHVPKFVQKWHSLGLFSEQQVESLHAKANWHRAFCCMRDRAKQLGLVYSHLALGNQVPKLKHCIRRKCSLCKTFLKSVDGVKRCAQCEPDFFK